MTTFLARLSNLLPAFCWDLFSVEVSLKAMELERLKLIRRIDEREKQIAALKAEESAQSTATAKPLQEQ